AQTTAPTIPAINHSVGGMPRSSACALPSFLERNSPMRELWGIGSFEARKTQCLEASHRPKVFHAGIVWPPPVAPACDLADVFHAELFHLARQRVAAPTQQFRGILLEAVGFAQRHADQN